MQVPLSRDYEPLIPQDRRYTLRDAVTQLEKLNIKVGNSRGWEGRSFTAGTRGACAMWEKGWGRRRWLPAPRPSVQLAVPPCLPFPGL